MGLLFGFIKVAHSVRSYHATFPSNPYFSVASRKIGAGHSHGRSYPLDDLLDCQRILVRAAMPQAAYVVRRKLPLLAICAWKQGFPANVYRAEKNPNGEKPFPVS